VFERAVAGRRHGGARTKDCNGFDGTEVAVLTNGFTVLSGTPILTSLVPAGGQQGQSLSVTITGQFTHFAQGTTQVSFGTGITVSNITVSSPIALSAQLAIDPAAMVGTRTLTVTTGTEIVSVSNVSRCNRQRLCCSR